MDYIYVNELHKDQNLKYGSETLYAPGNEGFLDKIGDGFNKFFNRYTSINEKYAKKFNSLSDEDFKDRVDNIEMNTIPLDVFIKANKFYTEQIIKIYEEVKKATDKKKWYQNKNQVDNKYLNKNFINQIVEKIQKENMSLFNLKKIKKNGSLSSLGYKDKSSVESIFTIDRETSKKITKTLGYLQKEVVDAVVSTGTSTTIISHTEFSPLYQLLDDIFSYLKENYAEIIKVFQAIDDYK